MSGPVVKIQISGFKELTDKIDATRVILSDLRPLWELFFSDFYKSEKEIFKLQGRGKYVDLSPRYKIQKQRAVGFIYPILFRSGALAASLLSRNARGSVAVATKQAMVLGTSIPYAVYHHSSEGRKSVFDAGSFGPRKKTRKKESFGPSARAILPRRPLWNEDPNSPMYRRWYRIADIFFQKAFQEAFDGKGGSGKISARGD